MTQLAPISLAALCLSVTSLAGCASSFGSSDTPISANEASMIYDDYQPICDRTTEIIDCHSPDADFANTQIMDGTEAVKDERR